MNRWAIAIALTVIATVALVFIALRPTGDKTEPLGVTGPSPAAGAPAAKRPAVSGDEKPAHPQGPGPQTEATVAPPFSPERATFAKAASNGANLMPGMEELASGLNGSQNTPEEDILILTSLIGEYQKIFGQNPPGGVNSEIVASLTGGNAKRLAIVPPDLPALNSRGELVDRWGTPFVFHPVSRTIMEILSAGPDRALWTADDVGSLTPANDELPPGPVDRPPIGPPYFPSGDE